VNLTRLQCFVAVAEELHFHRAAERLHMAQPPLSRQIRLLEEELGVTLFERSTRRVALTEAGRFLYPGVRKLLLDLAAIEQRAAEFRSGEGGVLRLGFVDSASYEVMPFFLRAHRAKWPKVEYELSSMSSDEQRAALLDGHIDLGIGRATGTDSEVHATTLRVERLLLAVGKDHRLAERPQVQIAETDQEALIGFDRRVSPSLHTQLSNLFAGHDIDYDPFIEATEYTTILGLVAAGEGVAVVPAGVRSFRPADLRYLDFEEPDASTHLFLFSRLDEQSPLVRQATTLAAELFS
jgi:DNA-binding transcriptional LysR family regulator